MDHGVDIFDDEDEMDMGGLTERKKEKKGY